MILRPGAKNLTHLEQNSSDFREFDGHRIWQVAHSIVNFTTFGLASAHNFY